MAAAHEADGAIDQRERGAITGPAGRAYHRIEALQQGSRGRVTAAPPGRRFMLAKQAPHPGGKAVERRATLGAGDRLGGVILSGGPSEPRHGIGLISPVAPEAARQE